MPKSKKHRSKKYSPKEFRAEHTGLRDGWLSIYISNSYSSAMVNSKNKTKKTHLIFNKLFAEYLIDCQSKDYLPSKDVIESQAEVIFKIAERKVIITDIEPRRMDSEYLIDVIKQCKLESHIITKDNNQLLTVFLIFDCKKLSMDETNFMIRYFKANYDTEMDAMTIKALQMRVSGYPTSEKMSKILDLLKLNILAKTRDKWQSEYGEFKWEESIFEKISRKIKVSLL